MSKSNKYGYVGVDIPEQSFGANKGIFNPAEINELVADNKWTQFGQLELIQTQDITTAVTSVDFTDIKENEYKTHLLFVSDGTVTTNASHLVVQLSEDGGTTFQSGTNSYQYSFFGVTSTGGTTTNFDTSETFMSYWTSSLGSVAGEVGNAYMYLYNLGDNTRWSFADFLSSDFSQASKIQTNWGGATMPRETVVNAIRIKCHNTTTFKGKFSLYGHKVY